MTPDPLVDSPRAHSARQSSVLGRPAELRHSLDHQSSALRGRLCVTMRSHSGSFLLGLWVRRGTKPLPQKAPGEQRSEQRHLACVARRSAGHRPGPRLAQAAQRGRWTLTKRGPSPRPRQNSSVARGTPRYADASALVSGRWCGASASDAMPSAARRSPRVGAGRFGPRGAGWRLTAGDAGRATRGARVERADRAG